MSGTDPPASRHQSTSKSSCDRPQAPDQPRTSEQTGHPVAKKSTNAFEPTRKNFFSSDLDSDNSVSDWFPVDIYVEKGEVSDDQDATITDLLLSEEQTYRETMRGIRSYMGWIHIPDIDSSAAMSDDNPFASHKLQTPGKVSVQLPTDEWLCRKHSKLNLTFVESYPSCSSEAGGLLEDQFL